MDVTGDICKHIREDLLYPGEIDRQDIVPVFQGVAKPIFQFLMRHTRSKEEARTIRANTLLHLNKRLQINNTCDPSSCQKILSQISNNQEIITKLQSDINLKKAKRDILKAYEYKSEKIRSNLTRFRNSLESLKEQRSKPKPDNINQELISQASERLLYLSSQKAKELDIPAAAIKGILESLGLDIEANSLFSYLINENKGSHSNLTETVNNFHPEIEMRAIGVKLKKIGDHFQVEDIDTSFLIDKLSEKIGKERDITLDAFNDCENMLNYTKDLRRNFSVLLERKESYTSAKLREFHKLEIELQSKRAQVNSLQISMRELIQKKEDLNQKILLLERQQQKTEKSNPLSLQVSSILEKNSSLRRDLGKYKIRIDEFMQNHIIAIKNEVPELLKPLLTCISREGSEFYKIQNMIVPLNVPNSANGVGPENMLEKQLRSPISNKQLRRVYEASNIGLHQSEPLLTHKVNSLTNSPHLIEVQVPKISESKDENKECKERLKMIEFKSNQEEKDIQILEHIYLPIWKEQPAQHCIPWKRDQAGLNITEALELWKYKYNN